MKKQYNSPATTIVEIKAEPLLTYSNSEAAEGATTLSRQSSDWEDE